MAIQTQTGVEKPYNAIIAEFNKVYPNIKVNLVEIPNDQTGPVLKTQLQGGSAPDVLYGSPGSGNANSLLPYGKAGYLAPLTQYSWATGAVPASAKDLYYQDNQLWALPVDIAPITWNVNQDVFDKLKLAYPATKSELLADCKTASAAGVSLIQLAGSVSANDGIMAVQIAGSTLYSQDPTWNTERANGTVKFATSQGWKDTLQTVLDMNSGGCFQKGAAAGTFDTLFSAVASGKSASLFAPAGAVADLHALNATTKFVPAVFPGPTAADTFLFASPSNAYGLNKAAKDPAAALKLLEFLAEPSTQDKLAELNGNASLHAVLQGSDPGPEFAALKPYLTNPKRNAPLANLFWPNGEVYTQLATGIQGLLTGQATIDQVLQAMDDAWSGQ